MRIARLTIDMHRPVPLGRLLVDAEIVREGKRLQLVLATIHDPAGVEVARATALRFRLGPGPDAPTDPDLAPIPVPPMGEPRTQQRRRPDLNGFVGALGGPRRGRRPGGHQLVPGHPAGHRRRGVVPDRAAGLGVGLHRQLGQLPRSDPVVGHQLGPHVQPGARPEGEWTGVATRAWYARDGIGHARADLFDEVGFVGTCTASLLVDEVAAPY